VKTSNNLKAFQTKINYVFNDQALLKQALTHKSAYHIHNERLEFLGDAVLNFVIGDILYARFPEATEGMLTRTRANLVNKQSLHQIAEELALGDYLYLGLGEQKSGGFRRSSILADALEAVIGAIYLDSGFEGSYKMIVAWFSEKIHQQTPHSQLKDPKTRLQEWCQAKHFPLPQYLLVATEGDAHRQTFIIECAMTEQNLSCQAQGQSRRIAEQKAAEKMLEQLNVE